MWTHITPQLNVPALEPALEWYRDRLGCRIAWRSPDGRFGAVYNGTTEIFFSVSDASTAGTVLCIRVEDIDVMYAAATAAEAPITSALEDKSWAMREFEVEDPYGHRLRIGQSTLA